ncbi:lipopolysaccharide biosynthesis protein [Flavobacterium suzhouense]|uniref:Lipopolysaccharide biosynthesis protein n=1 Tax=Flavobacterium suzhouense TaxID=1529638 RepID=A0ABW5NT34_9FLAO
MNDIKTDEITFKTIILEIKGWFNFILSKFKFIFLAGILGAALGVCYSLMKKDIYVATLTFALEEDNAGASGALGLVGQLGLDVGGGAGGAFAGGNLISLFKSRKMIEQTLLTDIAVNGKKISLAEMYIQENKWRDGWKKLPKIKNLKFLPYANRDSFTREQDSVLELIFKNLSAANLDVSQKDKKIGMISIETKSTNEHFSKVFTESLANVVSDFYIETKTEKSKINMEILQRQLDSIRGELNGSISGVAVANDRTFALNPALNVKRVPSVRKQVDVQANTTILTELIKQTELAKVTLRKETPLIQVIDRPIYPLKKERFGKAKGIVFGGFIGGFLAVMYFIVRRLYGILMKE